MIARAGALWVRLSVQVYNDDGDIERLADAVEALGCWPRSGARCSRWCCWAPRLLR